VIDLRGNEVMRVMSLGAVDSGGEALERIEELIKELPPELHREVGDFIEFLLERRLKRARVKPNFDWAGALKDMRDQYSSVELQHEISKWRLQEK
jgi:hypothetical protein